MWRIQPENATSTTLYFTSFDTEENMDVVKIFDLESQVLLAEYSGTYSSDNLPEAVTSPSGKMFITFSTNNSITKAGWEAYYVDNTVGIEEDLASGTEISVFPNPASTILNIATTSLRKGNVSLKVVSMDGNVDRNWVETIENDGQLISLPVERLSKGIYVLKVQQNNLLIYKKIAIN
jgi:hypothetical protein